jgi:hypothetical protein
VFVGQRREGFAVNLGEIFDLIHTNPVGATNGETNTWRGRTSPRSRSRCPSPA